MTIFIGADHRGFGLKEKLKAALAGKYEVVDMGAKEYAPNDDYPEFAAAVAKKVGEDPENNRGVVVCGSGFGVDIAANKVNGVRSALAMSTEHVRAGRNDDDVNVLAIAADMIDEPTALAMTQIFLETPFKHESRYERRINEISDLEK